MAIISCPECGSGTSNQAKACPQCGFPLEASANNSKKSGLSVIEEQAIRDKYKTNHILHFLLSIVTAGLWIIVWLLVVQDNNSKRDSELGITAKELLKRPFVLIVSVIVFLIAFSVAR
ncbi:hypothetical protein [Sulfurimonas sp.]